MAYKDVENLFEDLKSLLAEGHTVESAARVMGYTRGVALRRRLERAGIDLSATKTGAAPPVNASRVAYRAPVPDKIAPLDEILARRKAELARRIAHERARELVRINIDDSVGLIGLLVNGDEHLDNPGTRIDLIERFVGYVRSTPGLFACSMGDVHDAWIGRLQALYADSTVTLGEALVLCEWYIDSLGKDLLFAVGGNHNIGWWGDNDPLIAMMRKNGTLYLDNEVRIALHINDAPPITINARHNWPGGSQWNAAHGTVKAAQMGIKDDILLGGHTHVSGYGLVKQPQVDLITHCIQVASFKEHDQYQRDKALRNLQISPAVLCILDPYATAAGRVTVFHDVDRGVQVLDLMRRLAA